MPIAPIKAPIAAVILAAGMSTRMPGNKLLAAVAGKPIIRHAVEAALGSQANRVIVITGNASAEVRQAVTDLAVEFVENKMFSRGLSESLKCGVRAVPSTCAGVLILLGDMPYIRAAHIDALIAAFRPGRVAVPTCNGRRGNPVLWSRAFFPAILGLSGEEGAKRIILQHPEAVDEVPLPDEAPLIDIDRPEDLPV
ncbi:MAG: nucleotidyltransferase family protein [Alphaproteobacteria bacterium]|nr:nucleotidyltransferase family protein [Alphaproteobacteria bacterium]